MISVVSDEDAEICRNAVDLPSIISETFALGSPKWPGEWRTQCPFCGDGVGRPFEPFRVSREDRIYHCENCGETGDVLFPDVCTSRTKAVM